MLWVYNFFIGVLAYMGIYTFGILLFVQFNLKKNYPDLVIAFADVMAYPLDRGENYNFVISACFWGLFFAALIRLFRSSPARRR